MKTVYPVPILNGARPVVTQGFGGGSGNHDGVDIFYPRLKGDPDAPPLGTASLPVYSKRHRMPFGVSALAFAEGEVVLAGQIRTGGRVTIRHPDGTWTRYLHLRRLAVSKGDTVKAGQRVGEIFHNIDGYRLNHLHFDVIDETGNEVDPAPFLKASRMMNAPSNLLGVGAQLLALIALARIVA